LYTIDLFLGFPVREKEIGLRSRFGLGKGTQDSFNRLCLELGDISEADSDVIVILGGMAMPKIRVDPTIMKDFPSEIKYKKLVGMLHGHI